MSILDSVLSRFGYSKAKTDAPVPAQIFGGLNYGMIPAAGPISFPGWNPSGGIRGMHGQTTSDIAIASAWVSSNLAVIAREASTADLTVKRVGVDRDEDQRGHPFKSLWYAPNPFMGRSFIMQFQMYQLMLRGACYLFAAPLGNTSTIAELWPIPAHMLTPVSTEDEFIAYYEFRSRGDRKPVRINPEYITYTRLPDPNDLRRGLAPVAAALGAVAVDTKQAAWNAAFFGERNGVPSALAVVPRDTSEPDFHRVKAEVAAFFGGGRREVAVTRAGDLDFKILTQTLKDMEFVRGREFNRDEIDRALGFPGGYWNANATEANARHAKAVLIEHVIWPMLKLMQEDINAQCMPRWYGDEFYVEFRDIRLRNVDMELRQQQTRLAYWTIDELREVDGKPPLPDKRGARLISEMASPSSATVPTPVTQAMPLDDDEPSLENASAMSDAPNGGAVGKHLDLARWRKKAIRAIQAGKSANVKFISTEIDAATRDGIARGLATCKTADDVRDVFLTAPYRAASSSTLSPNEKRIYDALVDVLSRAGGDVAKKIVAGETITWDNLDADLKAALEPVLREIMAEGIARGEAQIGVSLGDGVAATAASEWARSYTLDLVKGLNATTQTLTQNTISEYLRRDDMTLGDVVEALTSAFGPVRAEAIAITEATRAASEGINSYRDEVGKVGIKTVRVWNTMNDDLVSPICKPLNGKREDEDVVDANGQTFRWGLRYPRGAPGHPRCRSFITLEVIEE